MFYVAEAFLEGDQLSFSSHPYSAAKRRSLRMTVGHAAVISAFGRDFAKPRGVPLHFHRYLLNAQDQRNRGDYGFDDEITSTQAKELIDQAEEFLR